MKLYTYYLMLFSAFFNGFLGIVLSFMPQEVNALLGADNVLITQILAAALMGIGILNYMAKGNMIGGIYSRPVLLCNSLYHTVSAIVLIKFLSNADGDYPILWSMAAMYSIFTIAFGRLFFKSPV